MSWSGRFLVPSALCLLLAVSLGFDAQARVIATGGAAVVVAPPAVSAPNVFQSNTEIRVWEEKQNYVTTIAIPFNIDGTPGTYDNPASVATTGGTLSAGSLVDSHMIHFDQVGSGTTTLTGSVEFEDPIIAVFVLCDELDTGDGDIGTPTTAYTKCPPTANFRPVDWLTTGDNEQIIISADQRSIDVTLRTSNVMDQVRVVTSAGVAAPVPSMGPLFGSIMLALLSAIGVRESWRRSSGR